jgi:hypothetical protein
MLGVGLSLRVVNEGLGVGFEIAVVTSVWWRWGFEGDDVVNEMPYLMSLMTLGTTTN